MEIDVASVFLEYRKSKKKNRFLESVMSQYESGRILSNKQIIAVERTLRFLLNRNLGNPLYIEPESEESKLKRITVENERLKMKIQVEEKLKRREAIRYFSEQERKRKLEANRGIWE